MPKFEIRKMGAPQGLSFFRNLKKDRLSRQSVFFQIIMSTAAVMRLAAVICSWGNLGNLAEARNLNLGLFSHGLPVESGGKDSSGKESGAKESGVKENGAKENGVKTSDSKIEGIEENSKIDRGGSNRLVPIAEESSSPKSLSPEFSDGQREIDTINDEKSARLPELAGIPESASSEWRHRGLQKTASPQAPLSESDFLVREQAPLSSDVQKTPSSSNFISCDKDSKTRNFWNRAATLRELQEMKTNDSCRSFQIDYTTMKTQLRTQIEKLQYLGEKGIQQSEQIGIWRKELATREATAKQNCEEMPGAVFLKTNTINFSEGDTQDSRRDTEESDVKTLHRCVFSEGMCIANFNEGCVVRKRLVR